MVSRGIDVVRRLVSLTLVVLSLTVHAQSIFSRIEDGDLIFVSPFEGNPITEVTQNNDSVGIDHVAIAHRIGGDNGPLYMIEAIGKGVCLTPADSFMVHNRNATIYTARVTGADLNASVKRALNYVGVPYDWLYQKGDSALYCSELVQLCFTDPKGKEIFPTIPMTFRDSTGNIPSHWLDLYAKHHQPVPEGEAGTNPTQIFRHPAVQVFSFFVPHKVADIDKKH